MDPAARDVQKFDIQLGLPSVSPESFRAHGAGVVGGDFDGNGLIDLVVLSGNVAEGYQQTDRGVFEIAPAGYDWASVNRGVGGTAVDYDADGDLDLFITRYAAPNLLLENDGYGYFTDVGEAAGLRACGNCLDITRLCTPEYHRSTSNAWGDIDRDGDLDVVVAGHGYVDEVTLIEDMGPGEPSCLFLNNGDGTFEDASDRMPQRVHDGYTFIPSLIDINRDGWLDLYVMNDFGGKQMECNLSWNENGTFVSDNNAAGLDVNVSGMGIGIGDQNDDGELDFLVSAWGKNRYLLSLPDVGVWVDASLAKGLVGDAAINQTVAWGNELVDMDNDTDLDAVIVHGYIRTNSAPSTLGQPDGIWLKGADGNMTQVSDEWGFDHISESRGVLAADLDNNGWIDLAVPALDGPGRIYMARCGSEAWVKVKLEQTGMNLNAIGARVQLTIGDHTWERTVFAGGTSYGTGGPPEVHFGLADHDSVDKIKVIWPDGAHSVFTDVQTRQVVEIERQ
ncbi:MAG: hypothetical protein GWP91_09730 [Rhodobacterales bacterium]|nr:hypothetical protein [Rhodobacterales bacterium]